MNVTEYFELSSPAVQKKVKAGVFIPVIHTGRKKEGATDIPQKVDADGDPLVRFIPKDLLPVFEEFGYRKAAIPKPPVSGASDETEEGAKTRGRKKTV